MPKYVATLPCNLSLMACFADINVSQGSVATYARCGGTFNIRLGTNLLRNLSARKKIVNRLRFDTIVVMSLCPRFFGPPYTFMRRQKGNRSRSWGPIYKISYDNLTIMPKLRSTYDGRLIYKTSCEGGVAQW